MRVSRRLARTLAVGACGAALLIVATGGGSRPAAVSTSDVAVVVSTRPLPALSRVGAGDVALRWQPASPLLDGFAHDIRAVQGQRLLVALPAGSGIPIAALATAAPLATGHRLISVSVARRDVGSYVVAGVDVEIDAAGESGAQSAADAARTVATGRVVAVISAESSATSAGTGAGGGGGPSSSLDTATVWLEVERGAALRLMAAEATAKALRVLLLPESERAAGNGS
jgi:hypothetical protein